MKKISKGYYRIIKQSPLGLNGQDKSLEINIYLDDIMLEQIHQVLINTEEIITYSSEQQKMKGFNMISTST